MRREWKAKGSISNDTDLVLGEETDLVWANETDLVLGGNISD